MQMLAYKFIALGICFPSFVASTMTPSDLLAKSPAESGPRQGFNNADGQQVTDIVPHDSTYLLPPSSSGWLPPPSICQLAGYLQLNASNSV